MPRKRKRISTGVYKDQYGFEVVVSFAGQRRQKRYPPYTPLEIMKEWRDGIRTALRLTKPASNRHTLTFDIERYLKQIHHLSSWREVRAELAAWSAEFGVRARWSLKPDEIRTIRVQWLDAGLKPKTVNNRVNSLARLYRVLDGRRARTPCDEVDPLPVERAPIQPVDPAIVNAVLEKLKAHEQTGWLRSAKTRGRFMVLAASGVRPSELMRARAGDVNLEQRIWRTRDGKGGHRPGGLYLNDDMVAAWQVFIAADAWGRFETSAFAKTLRTAGWPEGVRPYQLRHSVGMALSDRGADLADVSAFLGHSRPLTTRSHYVPVSGGRMQAASELLSGRLGWQPVAADAAAHDTAHTATPPRAVSNSRRGGRAGSDTE